MNKVTDRSKHCPLLRKIFDCVRAGYFMGSYYLMLAICIGSFIYTLLDRVVVSEDLTGTSVTVGSAIAPTLGLFGILATFIVVFFALRAESIAINTANSVARTVIENRFHDEETLIADTLDNVSIPKSHGNQKTVSIYHGTDKPYMEFLLWLLALPLTGFSGWFAYNFGIMSHSVSMSILITVAIGVSGILIAFTVVLFSLRVARLSQVAGRIESYSLSEELAVSHKHLYHRLLMSFRELLHQIGVSRAGPIGIERIALTIVRGQSLNLSEQKAFHLRQKCEDWLLLCFVILAAAGAVFAAGYFIIFIHGSDSTEPAAMSTILFILLIVFICVFFSGRVVKSAITSSKMQSAIVSRTEFNYQKERLKSRVNSVKKLQRVLRKIPELGTPLQVDNLSITIPDTLVYLDCLQFLGGKKGARVAQSRQFNRICNYVRDWWILQMQDLRKESIKIEKSIPGDSEIRRIFREARKENDEVIRLTRQHLSDDSNDYDFLCRMANFEEFEKLYQDTERLQALQNSRRDARTVLHKITKFTQCNLLIIGMEAAITSLDTLRGANTPVELFRENKNLIHLRAEYDDLIQDLGSIPDLILDYKGSEPIVPPELADIFILGY